MSAFVTYNIKTYDVHGEVMGTLPVRAVCKPTIDQSFELARERFGDDVGATEVTRSVPPKIGRVTPAARISVSARVKVLA